MNNIKNFNYLSSGEVEHFSDSNKTVKQLVNEKYSTFGSNSNFQEILDKANEITSSYSAKNKEYISVELVKLLKTPNIEKSKDNIIADLQNDLFFIKNYNDLNNFIKDNIIVDQKDIFDRKNINVLGNDNISFQHLSADNLDEKITNDKKFKYLDIINKILNNNKIKEILNKLSYMNLNFTKYMKSMDLNKYLNKMNDMNKVKNALENYMELFNIEFLIDESQSNDKRDFDEKDDKHIPDDYQSQINIKLDDVVDKDEFFSNQLIIIIFMILFVSFEHKYESVNTAPGTEDVTDENPVENDPNFFNNFKQGVSKSNNPPPDNIIVETLKKIFDFLFNKDYSESKLNELRDYLKTNLNDNTKLNTILSAINIEGFLLDSENIFSICLILLESNDDMEIFFIIFTYYELLKEKEEFKKKNNDEKANLIYTWFKNIYNKFKVIEDDRKKEETKVEKVSKEREKVVEKEEEIKKEEEKVEIKEIKKVEKENKIIEKKLKDEDDSRKGIQPKVDEKSFLQKYMIVIIIVVILLLVGGYFMFSGKSGDSGDMDF